ncbi:hypothetical protein GOP47_0006088 [Adiantum capillus-veneris]|uniref:Uncharacterized protein n=1 Tax=Adiantum capillus-veneris TaxID=13818 RepID=A0A9D4V3R1_ADICA|nr:hypothetical protein GOP47_0006088 [Adiantum capillus-veneris]
MLLVQSQEEFQRQGGMASRRQHDLIAVYHTGLSHKGGMPLDQPYDVVFGDGSPLLTDSIATCKKIHEEKSVDIPWKQVDLKILDNLSVMHGR